MRKRVVITVEMRESTSSQAGASEAPSQSEDKRVKARSIRTHAASMTIYERWGKYIYKLYMRGKP
jgi:hypothetical protein